MAIKRRTGSVKSPPILSHEFFIQNHADIISCLAMIIVVSLLFQATSPYAAYFVALQHNTTEGINFFCQYLPISFQIIIYFSFVSIRQSNGIIFEWTKRFMCYILLFFNQYRYTRRCTGIYYRCKCLIFYSDFF